ncbi:MAG: patatin-like phospholipase family protein [Nitrospirae bacterium]|nr:patatin-like phospholipase family protein [Nitrospirota bacterium]
MKLGLALGGGGVRGFAHLGVLSVLEKAGLAPHVVAGTSMGAIVAALYATLPSLTEVETRLADFFRRIGPSLLELARTAAVSPGAIPLDRPSLMDAAIFHGFFDDLIPDIRFEQTRVPLAVVAVDLVSRTEIVYRSGPLRPAVLGSAALPGIFPPIPHEGRVLIDGGWTCRIPVDAARAVGADRVVAVEVSETPDDETGQRVPTTGLGIVLRASEITRDYLARLRALEADLVLAPPTGHVLLYDVGSLAACARLGAETATAHLPAIRALFDKHQT